MGDRKPKKNSSGNADAYKAKQALNTANREVARGKDGTSKNDAKQ